jgi:hypothetical protein
MWPVWRNNLIKHLRFPVIQILFQSEILLPKSHLFNMEPPSVVEMVKVKRL